MFLVRRLSDSVRRTLKFGSVSLSLSLCLSVSLSLSPCFPGNPRDNFSEFLHVTQYQQQWAIQGLKIENDVCMKRTVFPYPLLYQLLEKTVFHEIRSHEKNCCRFLCFTYKQEGLQVGKTEKEAAIFLVGPNLIKKRFLLQLIQLGI